MEGIWINLTIVQRECKCIRGHSIWGVHSKDIALHTCVCMSYVYMHLGLHFACVHACLVCTLYLCMHSCVYMSYAYMHTCLQIVSLHAHLCLHVLCLHACLGMHIIFLPGCLLACHVFGRLYKTPHSSCYHARRKRGSKAGTLV